MASQGRYGAHNAIGIQEAFSNLAQTTAEDRAAVNNFMVINATLLAQVV